jgi:hypothetical protein
MAWSISWVAVQGRPAEQVLHALELEPMPPGTSTGEHYLLGADLADGWYLVFVNDSWHEQLSPQLLEKLSQGGCTVVRCVVEESAGMSSVCVWRQGELVWAALHDPSQGDDHLEVVGDAPEEADSLRSQPNQGEAPPSQLAVFRIPITLAGRLCGFVHDEDHRSAQLRFTELMETV